MTKFLTLLALISCTTTGIYAQKIIRADQLYNLSETDPIDQMIQAEARNLDSLVFFTRVWLTDQVATQFDPAFGVIINKTHILKLAKQNNISDVKNLFRLIISHEKMHALQAARLGSIGRTFQSLNTEERQILESQADMCAGYVFLYRTRKQFSELLLKNFLYIFRTAPGTAETNKFPVPDFSTYDSLLALSSLQQNYEGLNLFFAIGETEGITGLHPNPFDRKTSFELGVSAFQLDALNGPFPPDIANKITPAEWEYLNYIYKGLVATLGVLPMDVQQQGGFFEFWSQRIAKKIIHLSHKAATNILFTVKQSRWDTSLANPFHYFELQAKNSNPDSVMIDMDITMKLVHRFNPDDPMKNRIAMANHYLFKVPPKGTYTIRDSIMWVPGTDTTMPRVIYPGDEGSLYIVFPVGVQNLNAYVPGLGATQENPALNDAVVSQMLLRRLPLIQREFNLFSADRFKNGAGLLGKNQRQVQYNAYVGREQFLLYVPLDAGDKPFLSKTVGIYESFPEAVKAYDQLKEELMALDEGYTQEEASADKDQSRFAEILKKDKTAVYSVSVFKEYGVYKLFLEVFKE